MSIIRSPRPDKGYFHLENSTARDPNLSYRASGVLADLLSRPANWRTDATTLSRARPDKEGRDAMRKALQELEEAGYIVRVKTRDKRGRWVTESVVYDTPQSREDVGAGQDQGGKPGVGRPAVGEPGSIRSTDTNDLEGSSELHSPAAAASGPEEDPPIPERDGDDDAPAPAFVDWRPEDFQRFAEIIGSTHIHSDGTGPWNEGDWPVAEWYGAFRKRRKKPMNWPGQYFDKLEGDRAVEDYLAALGLEPTDPEYTPPVTDPWATSKSA